MNWVFAPQIFVFNKSLVKSLAAQVRLFDRAMGVEMGELQEHEECVTSWMVLVGRSVLKNNGSMELSKQSVQWVDFHVVHVVPRNTVTIRHMLTLVVDQRIRCRPCSSGGQASSLAAAMARQIHGRE